MGDDPKRHKARVYQTKKGQWRLSTAPLKLADLVHLFVGLQTNADDVFVLDEVNFVGRDVRAI